MPLNNGDSPNLTLNKIYHRNLLTEGLHHCRA